jgi:hypothetical protein
MKYSTILEKDIKLKKRPVTRYYSWNKKEVFSEYRGLYKTELTDSIGNNISIGAIVAFSTMPKELNFGVYRGVQIIVNKKSDKVISIYEKISVMSRNYGKTVRKHAFGQLEFDEENDCYKPIKNVIVITSPLFCLQNIKIAGCLDAIDRMKSKGELPEDFKLT